MSMWKMHGAGRLLFLKALQFVKNIENKHLLIVAPTCLVAFTKL